MAVSAQDNEQNRLLAEHTIRIEYLEKNMSTLSQATAELTMNTAAQTVQIQELKETSINTLHAVTKQADAISTLAESNAWVKRIAWGSIIAALTVAGWIIQNAIKG
jgi:hypothetical protein